MGPSSETAAEKPRIFISYARSDSSALAEDLVVGLEDAGFKPYLDRHDIAAAEDWEARLGGLIRSADTVVFILSPTAVKSERCAWEVKRAEELGKRLIPVEDKPVLEADVPQGLRRLQYISFHNRSFARALRELATALRQDVEWIREHTRLGEEAARWRARTKAGGDADDLLLRGEELAAAKAWATRRKAEAPEITPLVSAFLATSADKAAALEDEKRRELEERERLIADNERAQRNVRRIQRRWSLILAGFGLLVLAGTGAGLWAMYAGWRELMVNRAQFLAALIDQNVDRGVYVDGMLIGLEALPDEESASLRQQTLPLTASAQNALDSAWRKWSSHWGERKLLAGHTGPIRAVGFSPEGTRVLTGSDDNTARLWDAMTGKPVATLEGQGSAFSPDGTRVLTGSWDNTARLWDAATGKTVAVLEGHRGPAWAVAFSPDGKSVLTGSGDGTARLWDAVTGKPLATLEHTGAIMAVAFSPDGTRVLTGSNDRTARLWDAATDKRLATLEGHMGTVSAVSFSPDGARVLTGSIDRTARLWDAATGKRVATLEGHTGRVNAVAFSPNSALVLTGSNDGTAGLWDAAIGKTLNTLEDRKSVV